MHDLDSQARISADAVVFDLDGTLADTVSLIEDTIHMVLTDDGHQPDRHTIRSFIGRPLDIALAELTGYDVSHNRIAALVKTYRTAFLPAVSEAGESLLLPGVPDMLRRLREAGYAIGVVTAKTTTGAEHLLQTLGIRSLVDVLVGTERVKHGKPAPDSGLLALEDLGSEPSETWYVGDAVSDMEMAIAAGMRPMGVTTGVADRDELVAAGAEAVAGSTSEIADIVLGD